MFLSLSLLIFYLNNHLWFNVNVSLHSRVWINASLCSLFTFFFFFLLLLCPSPCCSFPNFPILEGSRSSINLNGNVRILLEGSENYAWVEFTLFLVFIDITGILFWNLWNTLFNRNMAHKKVVLFYSNLLGAIFSSSVTLQW